MTLTPQEQEAMACAADFNAYQGQCPHPIHHAGILVLLVRRLLEREKADGYTGYVCGHHKSPACKPCADEAWTEGSELRGEIYTLGHALAAMSAVVEAARPIADAGGILTAGYAGQLIGPLRKALAALSALNSGEKK